MRCFQRDAQLLRYRTLRLKQIASRQLCFQPLPFAALAFKLSTLTVEPRDGAFQLALARVRQLLQSPLSVGSTCVGFACTLHGVAPLFALTFQCTCTAIAEPGVTVCAGVSVALSIGVPIRRRAVRGRSAVRRRTGRARCVVSHSCLLWSLRSPALAVRPTCQAARRPLRLDSRRSSRALSLRVLRWARLP